MYVYLQLQKFSLAGAKAPPGARVFGVPSRARPMSSSYDLTTTSACAEAGSRLVFIERFFTLGCPSELLLLSFFVGKVAQQAVNDAPLIRSIYDVDNGQVRLR